MMKTLRYFLVAALAIMSLNMMAQKIVSFDAKVDKGTCTTSNPGADQITKDGVTIAVSNGCMNLTDQYRCYKNQTFTVTSTAGNITSVLIACTAEGTAQYGPGCFTGATAGTYNYEGKIGSWSGEAATFSLTASTNQVRITSVVVTLAGDTPSGDGLVGIYRPLNLTAESGPEVGDCATKTDCGVTVTAIKGTAVTYREEAGQETAYTTDLFLGYSLTAKPEDNKASATVYAPNEVIFPNVAEQTSRQDEEYFGFKMEIPEGKSININGLDVYLLAGNAFQWMVEITDNEGKVVYATQNVNNKGIKINNYNKTAYTNGITVSRTEVVEAPWSNAFLATYKDASWNTEHKDYTNSDVADTPVMPALDNLTGTYFVKVYYWGKWKKNLTYADVFLSVSQGATGIEAVKAAKAVKADNVMYNLAGQKVDAAYKGMVIMNGKKFMNK